MDKIAEIKERVKRNQQRMETITDPTTEDLQDAINRLPPPPPCRPETPPPPTPTTTTPLQPKIYFSDGSHFYVLPEWMSKYPNLNQPIIMRDGVKFKKYVFPTLIGQNLIFENVDTQVELNEYIDEINYYNIELNERQIHQLGESSGMSRQLQFVKSYIDAKKKECWQRKYKKLVLAFGKLWDQYMELLALKMKDDKFKNLSHRILFDTIEDENFFELVAKNIRYENWIARYIDLFKSHVIDKNKNVMKELICEAAALIPAEYLQSATDMTQAILGMVQNINSSKIDKTSLLGKITGLIDKQQFLRA